MNREQRVGWLLMLGSIIAYSTNSPISRGAILAGMNPNTLLLGRFLLAATLLGLTLRFTTLGRVSAGTPPLVGRPLLICLASGLANGMTLIAFYWGLTRLTSSVASMTVLALYPLIVLGLLALRGEPLTSRKLARLGLGLAGLYLLLGPGGDVDPIGIALMVGGAISFSLHLVSVQWYLQPYSTWWVTFWLVLSALGAIVLIWLLDGAPVYVPGWGGWLAILVQGVLATFLARLATYAGIRRVGSAQYALLAPVESALTLLWAALFLGESFTPLQTVGTVLIIFSLALAANIEDVWQRIRAKPR